MSTQVRHDRGALREATLAHRSFEGLFSAVRSQMHSEVGGLGESFLADGALVGFFSIEKKYRNCW